MSATTHRGDTLSYYFVRCMADLRTLQNKALERGASFLVYGGDRLCQGEVEGRLLPSRTPCWAASIAPLLNLDFKQLLWELGAKGMVRLGLERGRVCLVERHGNRPAISCSWGGEGGEPGNVGKYRKYGQMAEFVVFGGLVVTTRLSGGARECSYR